MHSAVTFLLIFHIFSQSLYSCVRRSIPLLTFSPLTGISVVIVGETEEYINNVSFSLCRWNSDFVFSVSASVQIFSSPPFVLDTHILHRSLSLPQDFFLLIISSHLHLFKPLSTDLDPFQYSPNLLIHHKFWTSYIKALLCPFPPSCF